MTKRARKPNVNLLATHSSVADTDLIGTLLGNSGDAPSKNEPAAEFRDSETVQVPDDANPAIAYTLLNAIAPEILGADIAKLRELAAHEAVNP